MTREEADFIGGMNMCDEISNEAYKKIMCHCEEQEPCEDAVSGQAVLKIYNEWFNSCNIADKKESPKAQINALPPVTPQLNTGFDKIRAEIEKKIVKRPWLDFEDRERDRNDAFLEVLDIIDKYKTKSEGTEE